MQTTRTDEPGRDAPSPQMAAPTPATAVVLRFPLWPLLATLAVQTLATAAAYTLPAVAPAVGRDLGVHPALIGFFISMVYGVGIFSALFSPGTIRRRGAVAVSLGVLVATLVMIGTAATGTIAGIALAACLMGLAYGATAPASTHLLVPQTPPSKMNVVLSLRQIGVPLGGVLAGLLVPPLAQHYGWRTTLLLQIAPIGLLMAWLLIVRKSWDRHRDPEHDDARGLFEPLRLLRGNTALQTLSFASFVYSGMQLCFIVYMTTHLTTAAGFDLVGAGQALAAYQIAGVISRPIWGWLADNVVPARWLLALQGAISCVMAVLAGEFGPGWAPVLVILVCVTAGATASGFTGIAYGEYARLGGTKRTEATGLGAACMFSGVMVLPSLMSLVILGSGSYDLAYASVGLLALLAGVLLAVNR